MSKRKRRKVKYSLKSTDADAQVLFNREKRGYLGNMITRTKQCDNMVKSILRALERARRALRRAVVITLKAAFHIPSTYQRVGYVKVSDIWKKPWYMG